MHPRYLISGVIFQSAVCESRSMIYYEEVTERLWIACPPLLIVIGTVGNIVPMFRKSVRSFTASLFLTVLGELHQRHCYK